MEGEVEIVKWVSFGGASSRREAFGSGRLALEPVSRRRRSRSWPALADLDLLEPSILSEVGRLRLLGLEG